MKILLADPPGAGTKIENFYPNLGNLYLISYAREHLKGDFEFQYLDGRFYDRGRFLKRVSENDPDVLGISFLTLNSRASYNIINELKEQNPDLIIICGGPHPTAMPKEVLQESNADFCVIGEGEVTFSELVRAIASGKGSCGKIDGIALKRGGEVIFTRPRTFIKNIDSIPFPAWDMIDFSKYRGYYWRKTSPETCMMTSRGCPYNCSFCSNPVWKSGRPWLRTRSPGNIAREIKLLYDMGIREIYDYSDEFNCVPRWSMKICEKIRGLNLHDLYFKCQLRGNGISAELANSMRKANFWLAHVGIESGCQETLDGVAKNTDLGQTVRGCKILKSEGIRVVGFFMMFNVWERNGRLCHETPEMCRKTLNVAKKLLLSGTIDHMTWSTATPLPGSELFDVCRKHGLFRTLDYERFDMDDIVINLPGVCDDEMRKVKLMGMMLQAYGMLFKGNIRRMNMRVFGGLPLRKIKHMASLFLRH